MQREACSRRIPRSRSLRASGRGRPVPPRVTKGRREGRQREREGGGWGRRWDKGVSWGSGLGGRALHRVVPVIPSLGDGGELFGTSLGKTCEARRSRAKSAAITSKVLPFTVPSAVNTAHCADALHARWVRNKSARRRTAKQNSTAGTCRCDETTMTRKQMGMTKRRRQATK